MKWMVIIAAIALVACNEQDRKVSIQPVEMTEEAVGHYCQMNVLEHDGPKAQLHMAGHEQPLWFVQIRDAFAFERMPEQSVKVAAIFVNDMGKQGVTWSEPGPDNWIPASEAVYVIGSNRPGGMGAPDFIPFADQDKAAQFARENGGRVVEYSELTDEQVLSPVDVRLPDDPGAQSGGS